MGAKVHNFPDLRSQKNKKQLSSQKPKDSIIKEPEIAKINDEVATLITTNWDEFILFAKQELAKKRYNIFPLISWALPSELIQKIGKELSEENKNIFKKILTIDKNFTLSDAKSLRLEIKKVLFYKQDYFSSDFKQKLEQVEQGRIKEFITDNPQYLDCIILAVSKEKLIPLMEELDDDILSSLSSEGEISSPDHFQEFEQNLLSYISADKVDTTSSHFALILEKLNPDKEAILIQNMLSQKGTQYVREVCKNIFPSFLIKSLPSQVLNKCTEDLDNKQIIEFLKVLDSDGQESWLNILAPEGSKKRELIELELNEESAPLPDKIIQKQLKDFYHSLRERLQTPEFQSETETVLEEWLGSH